MITKTIDLHEAIKVVCPIFGINPGENRIDFKPEATDEQRAAAQQIYDNWTDPPDPDWDGFAQWAMQNSDIASVYATAQAAAPLAAAALTTALLQVQSGNLANFAAAWNAVCSEGGATATQRGEWADTARDDYALPSAFVAVVRGQ